MIFVSSIVIISGSPSRNSSSEHVLHFLGQLIEKEGYSVTHISVKDISAEVLFSGLYDNEEIQKISKDIQQASGIIVGSPVYKGAYTGVLKALIDLMPQDVLKNKPVLPIMTGGSPAHLLAIEYTLKPVLTTLKGICLKGIYLLDKQIDNKIYENPITDDELYKRIKKQLYYFVESVNKTEKAIPVLTQIDS